MLRHNVGNKYIERRQQYFFQKQNEMFNAHSLFGSLFEESGLKLEQFFDDVQTHFVMPIERFVEVDNKELKNLKRHLDEREEKYLKHLRK